MLENLINTYLCSNDVLFTNKVELLENSSAFNVDFRNLLYQDNILNLYHYTTPNVKLYYPEPFIASGTFLHYDLWFLHIAIYQYWLWFFFVFIIVFFIITFLITIRWCNVRIRPQRETRGVSRSKCGDLITATVPVSWACSIIIHESTDSVEYYDGFGTTEMAVGIRAYQWGWEYYYPKDIDLNYRIKSDNCTYLGNSLSHNLQGKASLDSLKYLNYYSTNSELDSPIVSSSLLSLNVLNEDDYNLWDFKNFGLPKQAIRWAYKSITDSRIYEKYDVDPNFYSVQKSTNFSLNPSLFQDVSLSKNFNSEWSLPSSSSVFSSSKFFSNLKYLDYLLTLPEISSSLDNSPHVFFNRNLSEDPYFLKATSAKANLKDINPSLNSEVSVLHNPYSPFTISEYSEENSFPIKNPTKIFNPATSLLSSKEILLKILFDEYDKMGLSRWPGIYKFAELYFKREEDSGLLEEIFWELSMPESYLDNIEKFCTVNKSKPSFHHLAKGNFGFSDKKDFYKFLSFTIPPTRYKNFETNSSLELTQSNLVTSYSITPKEEFSVFPSNEKLQESSSNSFLNYKNSSNLNSSLDNNSLTSSNLFSKPNEMSSSVNNFWIEAEMPLISFNDKILNPVECATDDYILAYYSYLFEFGKNPTLASADYSNLNDKNSLIESIKNIYTFKNSLWKIYRSAFFENRSSVDYKNFSTSSVDTPVVDSQIPNFKKSIYKNSNFFLKSDLYKKTENSSPLTSFLVPKNNFFFEFPFFLSLESDSIRYSWFDWYSKSSKRVTKAMDTAAYNLYGSSLYVKKGDSSDFLSENLSNYENYQTKISNARKIHLPNWTYSLSLLENFKLNSLENKSTSSKTLYKKTNYNLFELNKLSFLLNSNTTLSQELSFLNTTSNNILPSRNYWKTPQESSSLPYFFSKLGDVTSKRDYILSTLNHPHVSSLNSQLLNIIRGIEDSSSDVSFTQENFFKKKISSRFSSFTSPNSLFNTINYFLLKNANTEVFSNKSQYKHMRKNISNMVRIHADKAVAMPIETRIQILTLSKDIIHSWSIPSAGIKIDCIPGYSSHKVTTFLLSGVYWGQCMEICGRFHHWMPIVVYFMKRDLFIMWCTHFISKNNTPYAQSNKISRNSIYPFNWSEV